MKSDAIAFGIAGVLFGLIAGWIIGSQQAALRPGAAPAAAATTQTDSAAAPGAAGTTTRAAVLDQAQVNALTSVAQREPSSVKPRIDLANLYFDAEKYDDAIKWYEEALKVNPKDANVSTDLGVCYYYTNQPDKALARFEASLKINPRHTKTLLNLGIVRAFGKQDLAGATEAWEQVIAIDPDGAEGQAARRALDTLRSAHSGAGGPKPGA